MFITIVVAIACMIILAYLTGWISSLDNKDLFWTLIIWLMLVIGYKLI